jgi:hypothetical protein
MKKKPGLTVFRTINDRPCRTEAANGTMCSARYVRNNASNAPNPKKMPCARLDAQEGTSALIPVIARPMISFWIWEVPSYRVVTRTSRK